MIVNFAENDNKEGGTICTTRRSVKPIYSHLCWLGVILSLGTLILRMTVDMGNAWPSEINNSVIIFGFVFFIITKHVISCQTIKHEKTLLWFLLILLGFNFLWSFSKVEYQDYGLYEFRIYIQYIIIFGTILIVPKIKNIIYGYFVALKKIADDLFSEKKEASEIRKINNKKYTKSKSKLFTWFVGKKSKLLYLLLLVFILGLGLRLINLGELDPAGDEYRHLLAAKHFLADGFYDYPNSHLTTNLVILTQKISNSNNMFFLRSPFAIIGSLSVLLLFFLGRKIHTKVGLIAAYLYACLPLAVGMSRYIRGYEITVFVLLFLTLLLLQRRFIKNLILRSAILIIVFKIFAFFDEDLRTDSTFLLFVMFTGIYLVLHYINRFSEKSWYKYVFLGIAFVGGLMVLPYFTDFQWQTTPELQYMFIFNYITINVMWFLPFIPFLFILIVTVIPFIVSHKNNFILATSFIVLFTVFVYIYFFEAPRRFQVRYLYSLIPYYILLLSAGIHLIFNLIKKVYINIHNSKYIIISLFIIFFVVFNPVQAFYYTITENNGEMNEKNQIPNYNAKALIDYLDSQSVDISKIITTYPMIFDYYYDRDFIFNLNEKKQYIFFPWDYEYYDRTDIYSLPGYWSMGSINIIKSLMKSQDIEYLVLHALPNHENFKYSPDYLIKYINNIELIKIISPDKRFGFYIYKVINE